MTPFVSLHESPFRSLTDVEGIVLPYGLHRRMPAELIICPAWGP